MSAANQLVGKSLAPICDIPISGEWSITILGSGTSAGVPVIGCPCQVCKSDNPKNHRTRSSVFVEHLPSKTKILIDTSPELRLQAIREKITEIQGLFITHTHADHLNGFDDVRAFSFFNQDPIPCWIHKEHEAELRQRFSYAFQDTGYEGKVPDVILCSVHEPGFSFKNLDIEVACLPHGHTFSVAYRFGPLLYATDFKYFPKEVIQRWRGKIHTFVASGLRFAQHNSHSTIPETIELFKELGVHQGIITHTSHDIEYEEVNALLPKNIVLAFDGLKWQV